MTKCYPVPEATDGRQWTIAEGSGSVDLLSRRMEVPLEDSPEARAVRLHEMAHARISPRHGAKALCDKHEVSWDAMQICEDARVSFFIEHRGLECAPVLTAEETDELVLAHRHNARRLQSFLIGTVATGDHPQVVAAIERHVPERAGELLSHTGLILHRLHSGRNKFRRIGFRNCTIPAARLFDALYPEYETRLVVPSETLAGNCSGSGKWGTMKVESLPLPLTRPLPAIASGRRFSDEGVLFAAPHRLLVDERIFVRRRRQPGGTLLIDGSGSMNLTSADLERLAGQAPLATVAIYGGRGHKGTLTIVSRKGRVATAEGLQAIRTGGGNIVDGPALRWLATQQAPRLWVSDGHVTGVHDKPHVDLAVEAQRTCARARIQRVATPKAALEKLLTMHRHQTAYGKLPALRQTHDRRA